VAFRAGSNTLLIRLFVMTGEVRLIGEWTPDLPERGSDGSSGGSDLWPVGGGQVGGSAPEDRLVVKMAAARGVSGCRRGRLPPWLDRATSRWAVRGASVGEVAGGPRCVRASWSWHWRRGQSKQRGCGASGGWWRHEICPALPEVAVVQAVGLMVVCGTPGLFGLAQLRDVRFVKKAPVRFSRSPLFSSALRNGIERYLSGAATTRALDGKV
jgi:hypothetical protein